ncbi:hypothetical protein HK100_001248, partial [Physocladia obscura]
MAYNNHVSASVAGQPLDLFRHWGWSWSLGGYTYGYADYYASSEYTLEDVLSMCAVVGQVVCSLSLLLVPLTFLALDSAGGAASTSAADSNAATDVVAFAAAFHRPTPTERRFDHHEACAICLDELHPPATHQTATQQTSTHQTTANHQSPALEEQANNNTAIINNNNPPDWTESRRCGHAFHVVCINKWIVSSTARHAAVARSSRSRSPLASPLLYAKCPVCQT